MPRTKEEFDKWFRESGGDPWGSDGAFVQNRLDRSLEFIKRHIPVTYAGTFVEIGAFNGDFTVKLATAFPNGRVLANDISEVALDQARVKVEEFPNVTFDLSDMATFEPPIHLAQPIILVMLETLYYLNPHERKLAAQRLAQKLAPVIIFVSGPIHDAGKYFDEQWLKRSFRDFGFKCVDVETLNYTDHFRELIGESLYRRVRSAMSSWIIRRLTGGSGHDRVFDSIRNAMIWRMDRDQRYRAKHAQQVIYCFRR